MSLYESVLIVRQDVSATQVESLADDLTKVLSDMGGNVSKRENWGLRTLAYRIKKNRKGHYLLLNIDAPAEAVHEYERQMRINEDILRYITIRVDELEDEPSVMLARESRSREPRTENRERTNA